MSPITRRISLPLLAVALLAALSGCETPARRPAEPTGPIPWTGAIGRLDAESESSSCTATLVRPDVIVTAAHCIFPKKGPRMSAATMIFTPNVGAQRLPEVRVAEYIAVGTDKMDPNDAESTPPEVDWAILRLSQPVTAVAPIPVVAMTLDEIDRRVKEGEVLSNLGYGNYGITVSRRLHRSEGCTLVPDWRDLQKEFGIMVITTCPIIKGDSGGPILITDKAGNRRLIAVISRYWRREGGTVSMAVGTNPFAHLVP